MVGLRHLKVEFQSIRIGLDNFLMNVLPDCWLFSRFVRPCLARCLGMRCGRRTFLRKGNYYGNLRNIQIGDGTRLNRDVFLDALDTITLGSRVFVGFQVSFITSTHELGDADKRCGSLYGMPIVVEDGVWIGACARISPGVRLGAGSVVSVAAVVTRDVPPNTMVAGVPARVVMQLDDRRKLGSSDAPSATAPVA
jgi:maltose O-acetyltransferase